MATFEESVEARKEELKKALADIAEETRKQFAEREEQLKNDLQGLNARIEAEQAALIEAKKRGDDTKKIQQEIDALKRQSEAEEKAFNTEVAEFQDAKEKKAKKDHAASIRRIRSLQGAYEGVKSVVSSFVKDLITATLEVEKQSQQFRKATGGAMAFTEELTFAKRELALFGGTTEQAAQFITTMNDNFAFFQRESGGFRKSAIGLATTMSQLGVDVETTTEAMDQIVGTFGGSFKDVEKFSMTILGTAKNMGMDPGALGRATLSMSKSLAELGPRAISTSLEFQKMGRQFGVNAESLLAFSDKFEDFDTASETVSQLNATFGTQLNTIDLMKMSETDRAIAVMDSLKAQGKSFDQLNKFQRRNLADITGLEVAELKRLSANKEAFKTEAMEREKAEIQSKKFMSLMDKMKGFFQKMILDVSPLVKALMKFSDQILAKLLQRSDNISKVYFALSKRIFAPLGGVITHIGNVLEEKVLPLMDMTGGSAGSFGETLVKISETVSNFLIRGIDYLANEAVPALLGLFNKANEPGGFIDSIMKFFKLVFSGKMKEAFAPMLEVFKKIGGALVEGAKEKMLGLGEKVKKVATGAAVGGGVSAVGGAALGAKFLGKLGMFAGPLGALVGAGVGAIGGGLIASFMQQGGYAPGGLTVVGERGPEVLNIPRGAYVTNNEMMRAGVTPPAAQAVAATNGSSGGSGEIHLYMDSNRFASAVIENINQRNTLYV